MGTFQPIRRARTKATAMVQSLKRMTRADERGVGGVCKDAGVSATAIRAWPSEALPTLPHAMALADALGYEIVLRRKVEKEAK